MTTTDRGTGQTLAMIKALPATGSVVVVHNSGLREYVKQMIHDVRGADVLKATTVIICNRSDLARGYLTGRRVPVIIDHAFWGAVPAHVEALVRQLAHTAGHLHLKPRNDAATGLYRNNWLVNEGGEP